MNAQIIGCLVPLGLQTHQLYIHLQQRIHQYLTQLLILQIDNCGRIMTPYHCYTPKARRQNEEFIHPIALCYGHT